MVVSGEQKSSFIDAADCPVGSLCKNLPVYTRQPPIEAVVFAWGVSEDGQLGLDTDADVATPKVVEALLGTRFRGREFARRPLVAGSRNTVAIEGNGQVLSWGWNARGTLGHGQRVASCIRTLSKNTRGYTEPKPRRVSNLKGVHIVQVAIGGWHCLAVSDSGQAYAWGGNEYGQCGVNFDQRDIVSPMPCVPQLHVVQVACGGMHSLVLTKDGEVWMWGEPWGDFSMSVDRAPKRVEGAEDIRKIACGAFHNLALNSDGEVFSWGINDFGQLGTGDTSYATTPQLVVGLEGVPIADVEAGGWHSLALSTEGEVYAWGRGEYGRLGLGDRGGASKLRATKLTSLEGHVIVSASCGGTHTMCLSQEGRLFVWGRGSFGRLGTGRNRECYYPTELALPGGPERWRIVDISAGGRHSVALAVPDNNNGEAFNGPITPRRWTTDTEDANATATHMSTPDTPEGSRSGLADRADSPRSFIGEASGVRGEEEDDDDEEEGPNGAEPRDVARAESVESVDDPDHMQAFGSPPDPTVGASPHGVGVPTSGVDIGYPRWDAQGSDARLYRRLDSEMGDGMPQGSPRMFAALSASMNDHDLSVSYDD